VNARPLVSMVWCAALSPAAAQSLKITVPIEQLEAQAKQDSDDAVAQFNLAIGYWSEEKYTEATAPLERALAIDPEFAPAWYALANIPLATGDGLEEKSFLIGDGMALYYWVAVDSVWKTYDSRVQHAFMIDPLVDTRIATSIQWRGGYQSKFDRARHQYDDGQFDKALEQLGRIVHDDAGNPGGDPNYEDALWYHALAAARVQKFDDAIHDLAELVQHSLKRETADTLIHRTLRTNNYRYVLGYMQDKAGHQDDALKTYQEALANDIGLYSAHARLAAIYEQRHDWQHAVQERQRAIDANPDDPSLVFDVGLTLAKVSQWSQAERFFKQAMTANPRDVRVPYYLGIVEQQQGNAAGARDAFARFIAIAPSRYERQIADAKQRISTLQ